MVNRNSLLTHKTTQHTTVLKEKPIKHNVTKYVKQGEREKNDNQNEAANIFGHIRPKQIDYEYTVQSQKTKC